MAKRVFFCFDHQDVVDVRARVVLDYWKMNSAGDSTGYFDPSVWVSTKKKGPDAVKQLIDKAIAGTTTTCVLIGSHTWERKWVRYEIMRSLKKGNLLVGVHINSIPDKDNKTKPLGQNPFEELGFTISKTGATVTLWEMLQAKWRKYEEIDGGDSYRLTQAVDSSLQGEGFNLTNYSTTYDWVEDEGHKNFTLWVV
jgi:hypothetical protein